MIIFSSQHLVTVGRDFSCSVWSGNQLAISLNWLETKPQIPEKMYRYLACRYKTAKKLKFSMQSVSAVDLITPSVQGDLCFLFLHFRFGKVEDQTGCLRLYTVQIPHKRDKKPPLCYLTKWDGKSFLPMLTASCGTEVISCLAIR